MRKEPTSISHRAKRFGSDLRFAEIDAEIAKCKYLNNADLIYDLIRKGNYLDAQIQKKLDRGLRIGKQNQAAINEALRCAVFDIKTSPEWMINAEFQRATGGAFRTQLGATVLPWADGAKEIGKMFLCMYVAYATSTPLACALAVRKLSINNDSRTVLVTGHVCERLEKRAGIRGSHVAFIAESTRRGEIEWTEQANGQPLLAIFDIRGRIIGYCPVAESECALQRYQESIKTETSKRYLTGQKRWRLKTFLLSACFERQPDGRLRPNRSNQEELERQ